MAQSSAFSRVFNCNVKITGIGSANTMTSVNMFMTAYATQNLPLSIHVASTNLSHEPAMGTHWKIVAKTPPMLHDTMMPSVMNAAIRKPREMKMRRYNSIVATLLRHTLILYGVCAMKKSRRAVWSSSLDKSDLCMP